MSSPEFSLPCVMAAAIVLALTGHATAMRFELLPLNDDVALITGRGEIADGDVDRMLSASMSARQPHTVLALDSPGGNLLAAERLAAAIHRFNLPVLIGANSTCASACFLLFAAAPAKMYMPGAMIGVHSASLDDKENIATLGLTTAMARDAAGYGVPPVVLCKMVATAPGAIAWLDPSELAAMGAKVFGSSVKPVQSETVPPVASSRDPATVGATALAPVPPGSSPSMVGRSLAFQQGTSDRQGWETWVASLPEAVRLGAEYWAGQRSLPRPGSCSGSSPEFIRGCLEARQRLAMPDARRKSDPEYRAGWNSF